MVIPWIVAIIAGRLPLRDNSFLWHVRAGSLQQDLGSIITNDPFSFTRLGSPWRTQSWLIELGYAVLDQTLGLSFVQWLVSVFALLVLTGLMLIIYNRSRSLVAAVVLGAMAAWVSAAFLSPRPVIASYLFLAMVVLVGEKPRLRWSLPLIGWVWASVHASFPLGIVYLTIVALRSGDRRRLLDPIALGLPTLFTAHGWGVVDFLTGFAANRDALSFLTEWATPNLSSLQFLLVIPTILILMYGMRTARLDAGDLWLVAFALFVLVSSARSVLPAWIMLTPLLGASMAGARVPGLGAESRTSALTLVLGGLVLVLPFVIPTEGTGLSEEKFPLEAHTRLDPDLRTFHDDVVGGYLIYERWPEVEVFVDDRAEVFGAELFEQVIETRSGTPSWESVFDEWQIEQAVARPEEGLHEALTAAGWSPTYEDDFFVILRP